MQEYYEHPFTSNSALSKLKAQLSGRDQYESEDAFAMGSLVDAMLTQPVRVDYFKKKLVDDPYIFTDAQIAVARKMKVSALNDSFVRRMISCSQYQVPFYTKGVKFQHKGIDIWMDCKCLYDFISPVAGIGGDYKSTLCTTEPAFANAVDLFDYDRARVFYMLQSGMKRDVIIGVSKKAPYRVFKVFIEQGDVIWNRGMEKLSEIVFKKYMLT